MLTELNFFNLLTSYGLERMLEIKNRCCHCFSALNAFAGEISIMVSILPTNPVSSVPFLIFKHKAHTKPS